MTQSQTSAPQNTHTDPADTSVTMLPPASDRMAIAPAEPEGYGTDSSSDLSLADRVSAAQHRIAERTAPARARAMDATRSAAGSTKDFVTRHPFVAVSGAIVAGAVIALALPGRPGRKVRGSVLSAGGLLAELASTYGSQMMAMAEDAAKASRDRLEDIGEGLANTGDNVSSRIANASEGVLLSARHAGEKALVSARHLGEDSSFATRSLMSRLRR